MEEEQNEREVDLRRSRARNSRRASSRALGDEGPEPTTTLQCTLTCYS